MNQTTVQPSKEQVGITGAGIVGLTSALLLADAGYEVTIVARNLPGDTSTQWSSPWAGALLSPHPDAAFPEMQEESIRAFSSLADNEPQSGVKKLPVTEYYDDRSDDTTVWYKHLFADLVRIPPSELPSGVTLGFYYTGVVVDPNAFLPWIVDKLRERGVTFIKRELESLEQLATVTRADILVNASGLGARELASDENVLGIRGQTMFIPCSFNRVVIRQGSEYTYVIPRTPSGGVILGGVSQPDNKSRQVDPTLRGDILGRVNRMTGGAFGWVDLDRDVGMDIVGFRPARKHGVRAEREGRVIHAYGVGGLGYMYSFGLARKVRELVLSMNKSKL